MHVRPVYDSVLNTLLPKHYFSNIGGILKWHSRAELGRKTAKKWQKIDFSKNQSNFDLFEKCEIYMPIRPGRYDEITRTSGFLEAFMHPLCFQNTVKGAIYPIFTLGRIQETQISTKSSIFCRFWQYRKIIFTYFGQLQFGPNNHQNARKTIPYPFWTNDLLWGF